MTPVANETTLGGRYVLERQVARGGMSEVWLARDVRLGRKIAIKLLDPVLDTVDFEREAGIVARLRHPNIVAVYDAGLEDGRRYIAMEWVEGESLRDRLQAAGTISPDEAARIGAAVASALASAHGQGVVHNDIKPENILLDETGEPRLSDFGVARITGATLAPGEANELFGTLAYVAPEILQGAPGDERSDVYALGTTLYEAASGRLPFDAASNAALAAQKLNARPRPLAERLPAVNTALAALVDSTLAFSPADRPAASEVAAALAEAPAAASDPKTPVAAVSALPTQPTRRLFSPPVPGDHTRRARGWWLMAAAGVAVVALAGVAFARSGDDSGGGDADESPTPPDAAAAVATATDTPTPTPVTPVASGNGDNGDDDKKDEKPRGNPGRGRGR